MIVVENKRTGGNGIYIGRPSPLGNPFRSGRDGTRATVIDKYRKWLMNEWMNKPNGPAAQELKRLIALYKDQGELHLLCWCAPKACHGDVIAQAIKHEAV